MGKYDELVGRLKERTLPSAFAWTGPKVETLFDQGLRHKSGKSPSDYLAVWLSMLRPFAYATRDGSWGELEKLLCIVMRNYVEMCHEADEAATAITTLEAELAAMKARGDRLAEVAGHGEFCNAFGPTPMCCSCGLDQALTEWRDQ